MGIGNRTEFHTSSKRSRIYCSTAGHSALRGQWLATAVGGGGAYGSREPSSAALRRTSSAGPDAMRLWARARRGQDGNGSEDMDSAMQTADGVASIDESSPAVEGTRRCCGGGSATRPQPHGLSHGLCRIGPAKRDLCWHLFSSRRRAHHKKPPSALFTPSFTPCSVCPPIDRRERLFRVHSCLSSRVSRGCIVALL